VQPADPTIGNYVSLTAVDRLTEVLTLCNAENPESRRELAISDLHVVRDLMKYLTFPTSGTGWDSARALLLLDELGMLETTSLGTAAARHQRANAQAECIAAILRRHRELSVGQPRRGSGRHVLPVTTASREQRTGPGHAS
jgi:hypothetical protein